MCKMKVFDLGNCEKEGPLLSLEGFWFDFEVIEWLLLIERRDWQS